MKQILLSYIEDKKLDLKTNLIFEGKPNPIITISREHGCNAPKIANLLSRKLSEQSPDKPWDWISKNIIAKAAKELKLSEELINDLTKYKERSFIEKTILFFSNDFYPSDVKIKNTIAKLIYLTAQKGNVIIVGRASEYITRNFKNSLHIKLSAPLDWRIEKLSKKDKIHKSEARKILLEMDKRRRDFKYFFDNNYDKSQYIDVNFNCSKLSCTEIAETIVQLAKSKKMI